MPQEVKHVTLRPDQRELITRYVRALEIPAKKWLVFNENYRVFKDMVLSLPCCRDFGDSEVTSIIVDTMKRSSNKSGSDPDESDIETQAAKRLIEFLESLPRKYILEFTLPSMPSWGGYSVSVSQVLTIKSPLAPVQTAPQERRAFGEGVDPSHLSGWGHWREDAPPRQAPVRLECAVIGYASTSLDSPGCAAAVALLKQLVFMLVSTGAAREEWRSTSLAAEAFLTDVAVGDRERLPLPEKVALYLGRLHPNPEKLKVWQAGPTLLGGAEREPANDQERVTALQENLSAVRRFFDRTHLPGYSRVAAAMEWYQDSLFTDDQTMAFIAACIGLESIFGEEEGGMTELSRRLVDRYAFMLGKDRQHRAVLADEFARVLKVRGELVHARTARLRPTDRAQLGIVRRMLRESIQHELKPFLTV